MLQDLKIINIIIITKKTQNQPKQKPKLKKKPKAWTGNNYQTRLQNLIH